MPGMHFKHSVIIFILLLFVILSKGDYYGDFVIRCQSGSRDGHNAVYLEQYLFNKKLMAMYNSTLEKMVGYTKPAQELAKNLNNNTGYMAHQKWKTNVCISRIPKSFDNPWRAVEPKVWLRAVDDVDGKHPKKLICSMYDFYPKQIRATWLRNGKKVSSDVMSSGELPSGNWLYQLHSYFDFVPKSGEKITCMVEHASLKTPKLYDWEPEPNPNKKKFIVGIAGLLMGMSISLAGFFYYRKKLTERMVVPTSEVLYPDNAL